MIDLCRGLQLRGHEVFILLRPSNKWQKQLDFLPPTNILYAPLRNSLDVFSLRPIVKAMRENDIEIIHSHVARDYPISALASFFSQIPLVLTRHIAHKLKFLHRLTFRQVAKVIAVSNGVAESLLNNRAVSKEKVSIIYNGVDIEKYK